MTSTKFSLLVICILVAAAIQGWAAGELSENGGANSNPHNLSANSLNTGKKATSETQICVFCHIPHGATYESTLWGRLNPETTSFPIFGDAYVQDPNGQPLAIANTDITAETRYGESGYYPNGASRLCLSCHDGVTAIGILANGDFIDVNGDSATTLSTFSSQYFGTGRALDLATSHPISFHYTSTVVDFLNNTAPYNYGPDRRTQTFSLPADSNMLDRYNRVQCTTCHDPHKDTNDGGAYDLPFWRNYTGPSNRAADYDNTCIACHNAPYNYGHGNP